MITLNLPRNGLPRRPRGARSAAFHGADSLRYTQNWFAQLLSADEELRSSIRTLRGRARTLCRDNPHAAGFLGLVKDNVIGPAGVRLQSRIGTTRGSTNTSVNNRVEDAWHEWSEPETASADGQLAWEEIQGLSMTTTGMDGETFVRMRRGAENRFGLDLQFFDADQLDATYMGQSPAGNAIRLGIEVNRFNRPLNYYFWRHHPSDADHRHDNERIPIPASEIIHLYVPFRINQSRGIPWFTPVLLQLGMLGKYEEAELVAALVSAAKMGFFVNKTGEGSYVPGEGENTEESGTINPGALRMEASPGVTEVLPDGYEFQGWDPSHPTTAFAEFEKALLRAIATGLGVSYSALTNDLSDTSYASGRQGLLQERDHWRTLQGFVARRLHRVVYREWLSMAQLSGAVSLPSGDHRSLARQSKWQFRGWAWVDPQKDMMALDGRIKLGVGSRTQACAEMGLDFEEVLEDLAREKVLAGEKGVDVAGAKPATPASEAPPDDDEPAPARRRNGNGNGGGARRFDLEEFKV